MHSLTSWSLRHLPHPAIRYCLLICIALSTIEHTLCIYTLHATCVCVYMCMHVYMHMYIASISEHILAVLNYWYTHLQQFVFTCFNRILKTLFLYQPICLLYLRVGWPFHKYSDLCWLSFARARAQSCPESSGALLLFTVSPGCHTFQLSFFFNFGDLSHNHDCIH